MGDLLIWCGSVTLAAWLAFNLGVRHERARWVRKEIALEESRAEARSRKGTILRPIRVRR